MLLLYFSFFFHVTITVVLLSFFSPSFFIVCSFFHVTATHFPCFIHTPFSY